MLFLFIAEDISCLPVTVHPLLLQETRKILTLIMIRMADPSGDITRSMLSTYLLMP